MKTTSKLSAVTILVLTGFCLPTPAWTADVFRIKQQVASAFFTSTDPSECIRTEVNVVGSEAVLQFPPGSRDSSPEGFVSISQFDNCTGAQVVAAEGLSSLADQDLQLSPTLDSATLNTIVTVFDFVSDTTFDVSVNLTWTSTAPLVRGNFHSHTSSPGCKLNLHFNGDFRPAQASGTVSVGATNFTPEVSEFAELGSAKSGNVGIGCE